MATTPGPWKVYNRYAFGGRGFRITTADSDPNNYHEIAETSVYRSEEARDDAELIALAPTLKQENERLRDALYAVRRARSLREADEIAIAALRPELLEQLNSAPRPRPFR
jgi:hypothetical protein